MKAALRLFLLLGLGIGGLEAVGGVLVLDGSGDRVAVPSPVNIPVGSAPFTVEAWVRPKVHGDRAIIAWGTRGQANRYNATRLLGSDAVRHYFWANDVDRTTGNLAGAWHHLAITWDGAGTRQWYLDGAPLGAPHASGPPSVTLDPNGLTIGSAHGTEYFHGLIDEVRVWNVARSAAEIAADYDRTLAGNEPGLVAYWTFDDGTANDSSPSGNNGATQGDAFVATATRRHPSGPIVGYWRFDTDRGAPVANGQAATIADDSSQFGQFGNPVGSPTYGPGAQPGTFAASLDGAADGFSIPDHPAFDTTALTIECFVNPATLAGVQKQILAHQGAWGLRRDGDQVVGYVWGVPPANEPRSRPIPANQWTHVAFTTDGDVHKVYVNGELAGFSVYHRPLPLTSNAPLSIGYASWGGGHFAGGIDELRVANTVLSPVEFIQPPSPSYVGNQALATNFTAQLPFGHVRVPQQDVLNNIFGDTFTVEFWMRSDDTRGGADWWNGAWLINKDQPGASNNSFAITLNNGRISVGMGKDGLGDVAITSNALLNDYDWHHVAVTRDAASGLVQIYTDGILTGTGYGPTGSIANTRDLLFGSEAETHGGRYIGWLDDIRLWNRVLSQVEIKGRSRILDITAYASGDLVGYWQFDGSPTDSGPYMLGGELVGNAVIDYSGAPLVPEPASSVLLGIAALALGRRRRRG